MGNDLAAGLEVCFERMRPAELRRRRAAGDLAFLPLGALEWHGPQNPLGLDALKAHHVCCAAARKLGGGAVFPPLVWGVPRDSFFMDTNAQEPTRTIAQEYGAELERVRGNGAHGGMDTQEQWLFFQRLLRLSLEQIAGFGFKSIYICTGHYPLIHWVKPVAVSFARATRMEGRAVTLDWGNEAEAAGLSGDHAGKWETSLMSAIDAATVDLGELTRHPELCGVGAAANAGEATIEQGEIWMEACTTAIAAEARWLVDHYPELPARHAHAR